MDILKLIGSNIQRLRLEAKISQEELAARMDVDQAYVSRLEAGDKNPTVATLHAAAMALGVEVSDLFDNKGK
jgi:transcriptional regulator with XRE-family HTH domain